MILGILIMIILRYPSDLRILIFNQYFSFFPRVNNSHQPDHIQILPTDSLGDIKARKMDVSRKS